MKDQERNGNLKKVGPPIGIEENVLLDNWSSWRVGGPAEFIVEPSTTESLIEALLWAESQALPVTVISGGTNVLVSDKGVRGLVVSMAKLSGVLRAELGMSERFEVECWAGTPKVELLKIFLKAKLMPALFLAGIPGDVGGGVAMNAGVGEMIAPREFVEIVDWIDVLRVSGTKAETVRLWNTDLRWSYRHCDGWLPGIILRVGISWPYEPDERVMQKVRDANRVRASKQPLDLPSCGSTFVNPFGLKAGQLIEASGLKGLQIGGAKVSEKHGNFILNIGDATATDIDRVIKKVQAVVKEKQGVDLKTEIVYLGDW